jgi:hypothetical protein
MKKDIQVMTVWRVPPLGKLVVEVEGARVESLDEVTHPAVRQRLLAAIGELMTFAGGYQRLVDDGYAPSLTAAGSGPAASPQATENAQARFLASLEKEFLSTSQGAPPLSNLSKSEQLLVPPTPLAPPSLNLVEEIDEILQRHLEADPAMAQRSIHLLPAPGGGLQIEVDGQHYDRPASVEDRQVQLMIKKALQEWESK